MWKRTIRSLLEQVETKGQVKVGIGRFEELVQFIEMHELQGQYNIMVFKNYVLVQKEENNESKI